MADFNGELSMAAKDATDRPRFVAYLRVSTRVQQQSGLGLDAQRSAVQQHVAAMGGEVVREYVEVESGKIADRQELKAAIAFARRCRATLLVAKLDRLSRNVVFLATLMESGVEFRACDNPHATPFTIHILAAVAQYEREMISKRTKEALAAAKQRGVALGSSRPGHWEEREERRRVGAVRGAARAAEAHRAAAGGAYEDVLPMIQELREQGMGINAIARKLNEEGVPSRRGRKWYGTTVKLVLSRATRAS
jgi:DNA invertase Pin-like site-specific DNA recombinase